MNRFRLACVIGFLACVAGVARADGPRIKWDAKTLAKHKPAERSRIANRLIKLLGSQEGLDYVQRRRLLEPPQLLTAIVPQSDPREDLPRPSSSLIESSLLTGAASDPSLDNELRLEMLTADRVDILVSFIKWAGLRLLMPGFEDLLRRGVKVRVITTSYLGASDPKAVEWLAAQPWSDGQVGTMGGSYAGSDQSALATLNPPELKTMIVAVGASNYYHCSMRQNGALELRFMIYAFLMATTSKEALADPELTFSTNAH